LAVPIGNLVVVATVGEAIDDLGGNPFTDVGGNSIDGIGNLPVGNGGDGMKIAVITEDSNDVQNQIDIAVNQIGMLVLIGMPNMDNTQQSSAIADMKITSAIAVGEDPAIWRDVPLTKPVCLDVVQAVITALQGFLIPGFARRLNVTRVDYIPDKKRQLYEITIESRAIIDATQ
jgi:hypothetical protein